MNETARTTALRLFLRVLSVGFLAAFIPWLTLILAGLWWLRPQQERRDFAEIV